MFEEDTGAPTAASPTAETETELNPVVLTDGEGSTPADSSTVDEEGAKPQNLLDVVKSAVKPVEEEAASPPAGDEGEEEAKAEGEADKAKLEGEGEPDPDANLPFHNHPRWKEVIAERDGYKDDAGRYRNIEGFMQQHGLLADEVVEGFEVMASLKSGTPEGLSQARDYFATRLNQLDQMLGVTLDGDLQEKVDTGQIDEETAQELARTRAANKLISERTERDTKASEEAEAQRHAVANATACAETVDDWEKRIKASDPDYSKKAKLVEDQCLAIVQRTGKQPGTPAEALALVEQAYKETNARLKDVLPQRKPVTPSPRSSSTTARPEAKTLRDAINGAIGA